MILKKFEQFQNSTDCSTKIHNKFAIQIKFYNLVFIRAATFQGVQFSLINVLSFK